MTHRTSIQASRAGLAARLALAPAIFAALALAAASGATAHENRGGLKTVQAPKFVTAYVRNKLPGNAVARARYGDDQAAGLGKPNAKAQSQIVADFNGDGKPDWAGLVRTRKGAINLVVIYSKGRRYRHALLQKNVGRTGDNLAVSVHVQKPGRIKGFPAKKNPRSVRLVRPGIEFIYFEKSSVVFYWKERRFAEIWTSD